jgi:hypothetical protein
MSHANRAANNHRRKARRLLEQAQKAADMDSQQRLLDLCERELVAAVSARYGELEPVLSPKIDRRKAQRRSSNG